MLDIDDEKNRIESLENAIYHLIDLCRWGKEVSQNDLIEIYKASKNDTSIRLRLHDGECVLRRGIGKANTENPVFTYKMTLNRKDAIQIYDFELPIAIVKSLGL